MKPHPSLCTQYLLFTVSVLAVCTQHVCGDDTNYNKDDSCSEEFLQDEVVDQRLFPRSVETNHTQKNPHGAMNNLSQVESDNSTYRSNRAHCNHRLLPPDQYEKRSAMYTPRCNFPFVWIGITYNDTCVPDAIHHRSWCATLVRSRDRMPLASMWCDVNVFYEIVIDNPPFVRQDETDKVDCIFPFAYKNFVYYECTSVDSFLRWCPTMLSISGEPLMSKYCHGPSPRYMIPPPKMRFLMTPPATNSPCKFPFVFEGLTFNDCTPFRRQIPWCAVKNLNGAVVASAYCSYLWTIDPFPSQLPPAELTEQGSREMELYGCRFPFVYRGVVYSVCTNDHSSDPTFFWCASHIDDRHMITKATWCHEHSLPPLSESHCHNCLKTMASGCKFPFKYENIEYYACESSKYVIPSCASDETDDYQVKLIASCNPLYE